MTDGKKCEKAEWVCCPPGKCAYRHLHPTANCPRENLPATPQQAEAVSTKFKPGDTVRKTKGSQWHGAVVGTYSTSLTPEGYAVESATEKGSVQIYPASALELWEAPQQAKAVPSDVVRDAERYRWLTDDDADASKRRHIDWIASVIPLRSKKKTDSAIDAAIAKQKAK